MATEARIIEVSFDETLEAGARRIIVSCFQEMMSYKEGAKVGMDIAFVHDMRVTARRLRTAMDNFASCFPERPFKKYYKRIKTITRTMGAVRDLDVLMVRFRSVLSTLSQAEGADIQVLITQLQREHAEARKPMLTLFAELEKSDFEAQFLAFFSE